METLVTVSKNALLCLYLALRGLYYRANKGLELHKNSHISRAAFAKKIKYKSLLLLGLSMFLNQLFTSS